MSSSPFSKKLIGTMIATAIVIALVTPSALGTLSGSGNATDIVQLTTTAGSISTMTSTANAPVTSGVNAFHMDNSGSNVDTFLRYDWSVAPSYGGGAGTSITIRGATSQIGDLLWFKQEVIRNAGTVTSETFAPLVIKKSATIATTAFVTSGDACTGWANAGSAEAGFSAASAGTFTAKYHLVSGPVDNTPATSATVNFCVDTTNAQAYVGSTADFAAATIVKAVTVDSSGGVLKNYVYNFVPSGTVGNSYCLSSITGTGTAATPDLVQCQKFPYETQGVTQAKLYALFDPPTFFPSSNQNGAVAFAVAGTQWNPYAFATTNQA